MFLVLLHGSGKSVWLCGACTVRVYSVLGNKTELTLQGLLCLWLLCVVDMAVEGWRRGSRIAEKTRTAIPASQNCSQQTIATGVQLATCWAQLQTAAVHFGRLRNVRIASLPIEPSAGEYCNT